VPSGNFERAGMASEIEQVLSLWREAEQLLDELPRQAPGRPYVAAQLGSLKRLYARLADDEADVSAHALVTAHDAIADARLLLASVRARLDRET
jgi:hypothetical protein